MGAVDEMRRCGAGMSLSSAALHNAPWMLIAVNLALSLSVGEVDQERVAEGG